MMELDARALAAGARLLAYDEVDSTNAEALRRARQGEGGPLWITATTQTSGRGRRGRSWTSATGNLHATLLLTDPGPAEHWPQLSFVAALGLHDAIVELAPEIRPMLELKWPNDLLLSGAKCAGILIEGEGRDEEGIVVIGIGVNCASHPTETAYPATNFAAGGASVAAAELFAALSAKMLGRLAQWNRGEGFATIRTDWLARATGLGENIRIRLAEGEIIGRFAGLDNAGRLLHTDADGATKVVASGDVVSFGDAR